MATAATTAPPVVVLSKLPEPIDEMANEVVVACDVVAKSAVKLPRVDEPVASTLPAVSKLENTGVPPKVPERAPPLVALKLPPIVVEAITAKVPVEVAPVVVSPPLNATSVEVAPLGTG